MTHFGPFLALSAAIHLAIGVAWGGLFVSPIGVVGAEFGDEDKIFCTAISHEEVTAQAATTTATDAAPSAQSVNVAEKDKTERDLRDPLPRDQPSPPEEEAGAGDQPPVVAIRSVESPDPVAAEAKESETTLDVEHETVQERADRTNSQQIGLASAASLPQIASNPSRFKAAKGQDLADFRSRIVSAIREASFFPKEAAKRRQHGETTVAFSLTRDGSVEDVRIVKPSGLKSLDDAALEIVRKASAGFPPFPPAITQDRLSYVVPIIFTKEAAKKQ